jgi:osomolarity two-component system response regulator SKN7
MGVPPLSDQGVVDAITMAAQQWETNGGDLVELSNPLAGSGWSDDTYQLVLQQFLTTGTLPDQSAMASGSTTATISAIGTSIVFPDSGIGRKRTLEAIGDELWEEHAKKHQPMPVGTVTELA